MAIIYNPQLYIFSPVKQMKELRALATLSKAAELGSLSGAANQQGITPQAASKALMQLERQLGVRLMTRSTRRLALTPEGRVLVQASKPALEAMHAALEAVRRGSAGQVEGALKISTSRAFVAPVLTPLLEAFNQRHPNVTLQVLSTDYTMRTDLHPCDLTLGLDIELDEEIARVPLMEVKSFYCAAPSFLMRHGASAFVRERAAADGNVPSSCRRRALAPELQPALVTNDPELELQAVRSGLMVSALWSVLVMPHLADGSLVPLPSMGVNATDLHLCYSRGQALSAATRAFIDFAVEKVQGSVEFAPTLARLRALERAGTRRRPLPALSTEE